MKVRVWRLDRAGILGRLRSWAATLAEDPGVLAVVLFGSLARGDATAMSDADVLIILEDSPLPFLDRLTNYKPTGLGIAVEVFPYTLAESRAARTEGWGVVGPALREGVVLFSRERRDLEDLLSRRTREQVSEGDMATYRATARRRRECEERDRAARWERAWEKARLAAKLLKQDFAATRVVVFGSLLRPGDFGRWSDVDIAAWGIVPEDTFRAMGAVMDLGKDIEMNLVDVNTCRESLLAVVEREGQEL